MKRLSVLLAALLTAVALTTTAHAAPTVPVNSAVNRIVLLSTDYPAASSRLSITLDTAMTATEAEAMAAALVGRTPSPRVVGTSLEFTIPSEGLMTSLRDRSVHAVPRGSAAPDAPTGQLLNCDQYYAFVDANGRYTIQRACTSSSAPWSFQLSASLRTTAVGTVKEAGMTWKKNGISQPKMSPHPAVPADYLFHGTYHNVPAGSKVSYNDVLTWRMTHATATLTVYGNFTLTGNRACVPGKPC